jgi:heat shock protein HtpX
MASFFDEIAKNNLKSILLMLIFIGLFSFIIYLLVTLLGGGLFGVAVGVFIVLIYAVIVYAFGNKFVLTISRAKEADRNQYRVLYSTVESLAIASQIPVPKVYIMDDPNPNAFATGRDRKHSYVCVTSGLLSTMDNRELQGVLAHEMSHIYDNDIRFMMLAVVFAGAIGIIAALVRNMLFFGFMPRGGRNGASGIILIIGVVVGLLAPLFALLIRLAISRRREYMADANGARMIRDPAALASALTKIKNFTSKPAAPPVKSANEVTASLYFSNPLSKKNIMNIFSTHPPIDERIARLQKMY